MEEKEVKVYVVLSRRMLEGVFSTRAGAERAIVEYKKMKSSFKDVPQIFNIAERQIDCAFAVEQQEVDNG